MCWWFFLACQIASTHDLISPLPFSASFLGIGCTVLATIDACCHLLSGFLGATQLCFIQLVRSKRTVRWWSVDVWRGSINCTPCNDHSTKKPHLKSLISWHKSGSRFHLSTQRNHKQTWTLQNVACLMTWASHVSSMLPTSFISEAARDLRSNGINKPVANRYKACPSALGHDCINVVTPNRKMHFSVAATLW